MTADPVSYARSTAAAGLVRPDVRAELRRRLWSLPRRERNGILAAAALLVCLVVAGVLLDLPGGPAYPAVGGVTALLAGILARTSRHVRAAKDDLRTADTQPWYAWPAAVEEGGRGVVLLTPDGRDVAVFGLSDPLPLPGGLGIVWFAGTPRSGVLALPDAEGVWRARAVDGVVPGTRVHPGTAAVAALAAEASACRFGAS